MWHFAHTHWSGIPALRKRQSSLTVQPCMVSRNISLSVSVPACDRQTGCLQPLSQPLWHNIVTRMLIPSRALNCENRGVKTIYFPYKWGCLHSWVMGSNRKIPACLEVKVHKKVCAAASVVLLRARPKVCLPSCSKAKHRAQYKSPQIQAGFGSSSWEWERKNSAASAFPGSTRFLWSGKPA